MKYIYIYIYNMDRLYTCIYNIDILVRDILLVNGP